MTYCQGRIPVSWTLEEIDGLDWTREPFNDPAMAGAWMDIYGPIFRTGFQADHRSRQLDCNPQILRDLQAQGIDLDRTGFSYYKMMPGDILPYHSDTYARYISHHKVDIADIWRVIVFPQDWQPGFLFEIEGRPITQYRAGDFVAWQAGAEHMAGNLGRVPRYTLQITGVMRGGL
jgi:hypothetical protein